MCVCAFVYCVSTTQTLFDEWFNAGVQHLSDSVRSSEYVKQVKDLKDAMETAQNYTEWSRAAVELDTLEGRLVFAMLSLLSRVSVDFLVIV